nr:TonB-dependent receptor [Polymorphobacter fuscus]
MGAVTSALIAGPALAQQRPVAATADAPDEAATIVVTGSLIRNTTKDAALPVDVLTAADLINRGSPSLLDLTKNLASMGPVLGDSNQFSTLAQGVVGTGSVNLRGLGPQRTLVLLNGRRTTTTPDVGSFGVDTNLLPIAAVGRIEILKDGAAATYGSDAIAGVVNFIIRTDLNGFDGGVQYKLINGSAGDYTADLAWGWQDDRSRVLLSAGYQHRSELSTTKRDWTRPAYTTNPSGWSVLGQPGSFLPRNGAAPTAGVQRDANCNAVGGYAGFSGTTPACYFTYIPFDNLVEKQTRYQLYGEANTELTDKVTLHVEALYAKTDVPGIRFSPSYPPTSGPNGPGSVNVFSVTSAGPTPFANNPGALTALTQAGLSPGAIAATNNIGLTLWRPLGNGGNPTTGGLGGQKGFRNYDIYRVSGSVDYRITENFGFNGAITYSDETTNTMTTDIQIDRLQRALNGLGGPNCNGIAFGSPGSTCQAFNPFSNGYGTNPSSGQTNPGFVSANANSNDLVAWLFDSPASTRRQNLFVADAVFDGSFDVGLSGGPIGFAIGSQFRSEKYESSTASLLNDQRITPCPVPGVTNCQFRTGPYIFLGQALPNTVKGQVWAVFGEVAVPITERFDLRGALRFEDYGGLTGSTLNPKGSVRWKPLDWLTLRGSIGTTFRGPTPNDRRTGGVTGLSGIIAAGNNFKSVDFLGNPSVGPETAFTYNVGAIVATGGLRASVDFWNYDFKDQIVTVPANVIATAVAGTGNGTQTVNCGSPLRDLITFASGNACIQGVTIGNDIARVRSDIVNGAKIHVQGIDFEVSYTFDDVMGGTLEIGANASHTLKWDQEAFSVGGVLVSPAYSAVGFTNYDRFPGTISAWRGRGNINYNVDKLNLRYELGYISGATDNRAQISVQAGIESPTPGAPIPITFGQQIGEWVTHDFHITYETPWDMTLQASVVNILDRDPPSARLEISYDPFIGNPLGRVFQFGVRKRF